MAADCLTLDNYPAPAGSIESAGRRLAAMSLRAPRFLRSLQARAAAGDCRAAESADRECACTEETSLVDLVAKGKTGDTVALEALIKHYQARIAGFVFTCVNDGEAVEDLCQTIFYKMLMGLPRLKTAEKFESWLFRIARNACFDHLRKRQLRRIFLPWSDADDVPETPPHLATESSGEYLAEAFRKALMRLPKRQRELVALLQDDQLSYEKLAEITNSSVGSVKSRLFRARRQLREYLQNER